MQEPMVLKDQNNFNIIPTIANEWVLCINEIYII